MSWDMSWHHFLEFNFPPAPPQKKKNNFFFLNPFQWCSSKFHPSTCPIFHSPKPKKRSQLNSSPTWQKASQPPSPSPKRFGVGTLLWPKPSNSAVGTVECNSAPNPEANVFTDFWRNKKRKGRAGLPWLEPRGFLGGCMNFEFAFHFFLSEKKRRAGLPWLFRESVGNVYSNNN